MLPSGHENSDRESNPIPQPVYTYLSASAFLVSFTDPNKQCKILMYLNFLFMDLVCKKYIDLLHFY